MWQCNQYIGYILLLVIVTATLKAEAIEKVSFKSADDTRVTADLHFSHPINAPLILLFHQAGWSRGEYLEIAPTLNRLGYNCIAADLRSGNLVNGIRNETAEEARRLLKPSSYLDAYQDMVATLQYARNICPDASIIVLGSSYSASLAMILASENNEDIQAVVSYSPGEYFASSGKGKDFIQQKAKLIKCAVYIACARNEQAVSYPIYEAVSYQIKTFYMPSQTPGNHGAKSLFVKYDDHKAYWSSLLSFLSSL